MEGIHFTIWSLLILAGAVQGLFLSFFLFAKRENRQANRWLGALLVAHSLHLAEYAAHISGISMQYPALIAITYPLLFCFGPFYFLYCRSLLGYPCQPAQRTLLHFLLPLTVLLMMLPFYIKPGQEKIDIMLGTVNTGMVVIPAEQLMIMGAHITQTVVYIFGSFRFVRNTEMELKEFLSDTIVVKKIAWLKAFNRYLSVYFMLYLVLVIFLGLQHAYSVEADYWLFLIDAISVYVIGYAALNNPEILKKMPSRQLISELNNKEAPTPAVTIGKYPGLKQTLLEYMETSKPYLKSDLKISDLAASLAVPSHQLSELINNEFEVNFYDFINQYRVEEAKKLLITNQSYKILVIGYEVGFNSKATFNRVFKKITNCTPSEYKEQFSQIS
jgi:AraC-like DNA-binding protein/predicted secreted protein